MTEVTTHFKGGYPLSITHLHQFGRTGQTIYLILLLAAASVIISLPFIKITTSFSTRGVIHTSLEHSEIVIPVNGRTDRISVYENKHVAAGDTLLVIDFASSIRDLNDLGQQRKELLSYLSDIAVLSARISRKLVQPPTVTAKYGSSWLKFTGELQKWESSRLQALRTFERYNKLYDHRVISLSELEKYRFELEQAESACRSAIDAYRYLLQSDAEQYRRQLAGIDDQMAVLERQYKLHVVTAPVAGFAQSVKLLAPGHDVLSGQKLAAISPDGRLSAHCMVPASQIGYVKMGQEVNIQIDTYDPNIWGRLRARVLAISDDVSVINDIPVFRITCLLNEEYLLSGPRRVNIKKGMTFTGRFVREKISLLEFLFAAIRNKIDPVLN